MSIEKVKKCFLEFKRNQDQLLFVDQEMNQLIWALAEHILQEDDKCQLAPSSDYLTLNDFEEKHKFITAKTLRKHCNYDDEFSSKCARKFKKNWYVHESKTCEHFKAIPSWTNRIKRWSFARNEMS